MGDIVEIEIGEDPKELSEDIIQDKDELKKVVSNLCKEYNQAKSDRFEKERTWAKWRRQFEARPFSARKDYPYPNASNTVPPLSLIVGQAIFGHLKEMYDAVDPPWYVKPLREGDDELVKQTRVLTKYFNILSKSRTDLNLKKFKRDFFQEVAVMGTCYVKVPWTTKEWNFKKSKDESVSAKLHDGPELLAIPVEDMVYPEAYKDIQSMPWFAHTVCKAEYEIQNLKTSGVYDEAAADKVLNYGIPISNERTETEDSIKQSYPSRDGEFEITEFYFYYDADGDGVFEDLVFSVHVPSETVLRQSYNEFGYRMISVGTFIERTFALEGRGSGQTTEYQQDEIEGIHNIRNDNMKFSNMRLLVAKRGTLTANEAIYPGKILLADSPKDDIVPLQLGEVYPSSLQAENMTMNYAREASGMSSIMSGFSDQRLGTRDTASGQSLRLSRGRGLFSAVGEGLNECFSEVGMMLFFQMVKNKERLMANERIAKRLTDEELDLLETVLSVPLQEVPLKLAFSIRTCDVDQTFEVKRQNILSLTQLFSQYAMQIIPLSDKLLGPQGQQMRELAPDAYANDLSIYVAATKLISETFKFFGEEEPDKFVPDTKKHELFLDMVRVMNEQLVEQNKMGQNQGQGQRAGQGLIGIEEELNIQGEEENVSEETGFNVSE